MALENKVCSITLTESFFRGSVLLCLRVFILKVHYYYYFTFLQLENEDTGLNRHCSLDLCTLEFLSLVFLMDTCFLIHRMH